MTLHLRVLDEPPSEPLRTIGSFHNEAKFESAIKASKFDHWPDQERRMTWTMVLLGVVLVVAGIALGYCIGRLHP